MLIGGKEDIMTKFVGAEYLIASMLIEKKKLGTSYVTLDELGKCGVFVQRMSVERNIDAVFLTSKAQFFAAIYDFSDYFECIVDIDNQINGIAIQNSKDIDDLEYRFMGRLPQDIFDFLSNMAKEYAA